MFRYTREKKLKSVIKNNPPYFSGFEPLGEKYENVIKETSAPFYFKNEKSKAIVICVHGFRADTYEQRPVAKACASVGIDALGSLMPGHGYRYEGSSYKMWSSVNYSDFLAGLRNDIKIARKKYEKVFIFGQSMGGALALIIAGEGLVDAVATTAPGIIKIPKIFLPFIKIFVFLFGRKLMKSGPEGNFYNSGYEYVPICAINAIIGMLPHSRKMVKNINCPFLLVVSENDNMVNPKKILKALPENVKKNAKIEWYNESGHVMTLDVKGKEICESVARFFKKQC